MSAAALVLPHLGGRMVRELEAAPVLGVGYRQLAVGASQRARPDRALARPDRAAARPPAGEPACRRVLERFSRNVAPISPRVRGLGYGLVDQLLQGIFKRSRSWRGEGPAQHQVTVALEVGQSQVAAGMAAPRPSPAAPPLAVASTPARGGPLANANPRMASISRRLRAM